MKLITLSLLAFGSFSAATAGAVSKCDACQALAVSLVDKVQGNLSKVSKKKGALSVYVEEELEANKACGYDTLTYFSDKLDQDAGQFQIACKSVLSETEETWEEVLPNSKNLQWKKVAEKICLKKKYCSKLWTEEEEPRNRESKADRNKRLGTEWLNENKNKEGVHTLPSGLQYKVLKTSGKEQKPKAEDTVKVHYKGTLIEGTEFDSSFGRGEPAEFGLNQVIRGWTEGLQLMSEGDSFEFYIPSDLGYGPGGSGKIGPNSALIFHVDLLEIKKARGRKGVEEL
eukprot:GDKI01024525.1.p1 GENE.GDKI01024525.1~~GDKI01024525.1.p1  ORF type:complete len:285 (-),score=64.24 GDKI01024525.1:30-884(-)